MTASQTFRNTVIVLLTLVIAFAVYQSLHILIVLVIALIIASSVRPLVMWLVRRRIGIGWSALLVYLLLAISLFILRPFQRNKLPIYTRGDLNKPFAETR
jgi:predicted PurR-regulated permease PerM